MDKPRPRESGERGVVWKRLQMENER